MQQAERDKWKKNNRRAFTLYEMLIVLGLVIVLVTATAVYNRDIGRQIVIAREHAKVLGMVVKARSAGFSSPNASPAESICGYGVHIDQVNRTVIFFKDLGVVATPCSVSANHTYDAGEKIDQVILDPSVDVTSSIPNADIVFIPPFGNVSINNDETIVSVTITVHSASADTSKQVRVNAYGQITE
jgi:Tfp pilus assembly protein FimT